MQVHTYLMLSNRDHMKSFKQRRDLAELIQRVHAHHFFFRSLPFLIFGYVTGAEKRHRRQELCCGHLDTLSAIKYAIVSLYILVLLTIFGLCLAGRIFDFLLQQQWESERMNLLRFRKHSSAVALLWMSSMCRNRCECHVFINKSVIKWDIECKSKRVISHLLWTLWVRLRPLSLSSTSSTTVVCRTTLWKKRVYLWIISSHYCCSVIDAKTILGSIRMSKEHTRQFRVKVVEKWMKQGLALKLFPKLWTFYVHRPKMERVWHYWRPAKAQSPTKTDRHNKESTDTRCCPWWLWINCLAVCQKPCEGHSKHVEESALVE